ncbi:hypothetical protein AB6C54_18445 [Vibrio splendidus]
MRLASMSSKIPSDRIPAEHIAKAAGSSVIEAKVFSRLFGIESVSAHNKEMDLQSALSQVLSEAIERMTPNEVDTLIYVHAFPIQCSDDTDIVSDVIKKTPGLSKVKQHFEIDQHNCAGGFWGLSLAQNLLSSGKAQRIAIVVGDTFQHFTPNERYIPGCTMMADGFVALIVDELAGEWQIEKVFTNHNTEFHQGLFGGDEQNKAFYQAHDSLVSDALRALDDDVYPFDAILPHNINRVSWMNFIRRFPNNEKRLDLGLLPDIGHCCAADPFLLLEQYYQQSTLNKKKFALVSIGSGGFVGACSIARHELNA